MTAPHDDLADSREYTRGSGAAVCPRCGVRRVGAFRSCLSCGYEYEPPKNPQFGPPPAEDRAAPLVGPETHAAAEPTSVSTAGVRPAPVPAAASIPAPPPAPHLSTPTPTPTPLPAAEAAPPIAPLPATASTRSAASPAHVPAVTRPSRAWSSPHTSSVAKQVQSTRRGLRTLGPREQRLAAGAFAVVLIAAVGIVALTNGFGKLSAEAQPSFAATVTAVPLPSINEACIKQVGPFVGSLEGLDAAVGPNLAFEEYAQMVTASQAARSPVKISQLDPQCIAVFAAAQAVLGEYAEAYNTWNDCNTTTGCTKPSIESSIEGRWGNARATLSSIKASMP